MKDGKPETLEEALKQIDLADEDVYALRRSNTGLVQTAKEILSNKIRETFLKTPKGDMKTLRRLHQKAEKAEMGLQYEIALTWDEAVLSKITSESKIDQLRELLQISRTNSTAYVKIRVLLEQKNER